MLILGIDTSCDDTCASVVEDGVRIISNIVSTQTEIHKKYGGIVPELASRRHIEMIWPVVDEAVKGAGIEPEDLSAIAVCHGPGLIGSLLIGCSFAKAICYSKNVPLVTVNHLEGHIFSCFLREGGFMEETPFPPCTPEFPFLSLIVSGGHTCLYRVDGFGRYRELGRTRDDAAGEAYDKVSKLLGLGYPGGPVIDKLAQDGNPDAADFPRPYLPESFDFSFSGLKTAVLNFVKTTVISQQSLVSSQKTSDQCPMTNDQSHLSLADIAASFQASVVDVLVKKTEWAVKKERIKRVALSGGVSANSELRKGMKGMGDAIGVEIFIPPVSLCTDNAAMIAGAGYHHFNAGNIAGLDLNPQAYLPL
ncbi:MAG: tRNA (adenosine(37)-N6)-threonylcarbamoyltransferase complex transferase subunit TsaD [Nitrospirota bacterium]